MIGGPWSDSVHEWATCAAGCAREPVHGGAFVNMGCHVLVAGRRQSQEAVCVAGCSSIPWVWDLGDPWERGPTVATTSQDPASASAHCVSMPLSYEQPTLASTTSLSTSPSPALPLSLASCRETHSHATWQRTTSCHSTDLGQHHLVVDHQLVQQVQHHHAHLVARACDTCVFLCVMQWA